jgi:hypothetical protein
MMRPTVSRPFSGKRLTRQRGMVTAVVMLFLIATVVFALSQMLNVSSGNVIDGQRQGDSTAAFFLAESGLETARASVNSALGGSFTNASCTGIATNFNLGRGAVGVTAISTPATCDNSGGTPCATCTATSTGTVGVSTRTLTQAMQLTVNNGVTCNAATADCTNSSSVTWQLNLKNTSAQAAMAIFNLTYIHQGNATASCAVASNCQLQLDLVSPSSGANSTGLQGNSVLIPANTTYPIYQIFPSNKNRNLAEVGAFFRGTTAPVLTGPGTPGGASYWSGTTVGTGSSGSTNDGTLTSTGSCAAPSANAQTCTRWCYGGDTLVFSFAGNVTQLTDQLSSVTFGTNAGTGQNMAMTQVTKYPSSLIAGAPTNVDAEIWYASNPNFTPASTPLAVNASSYKGRGSGAIGARWTSNSSDTTSISTNNTTGVTTLTVGNSFTGYPNQIISVGDTVTDSGGSPVGTQTCTTNCGTITAQLTSTETGGMTTGRGGRGTYQLSFVASRTVTAANNRVWTINSNVLHVTACTICYFANGDTLSGLIGGASISSQASASTSYGLAETAGGVGRYVISGSATYVALGTNLYAGTPGTTLYLPSTSSQPAVTSSGMRIAVKSGTGVLAPAAAASAASGKTVTSVSTPNAATRAFTVGVAPTTPLDLATLCAGTCAFFVPGTTTTFALGGVTAHFNEWASGFTCLSGVDITPEIVTSSSTARGRWTEVVN